MAGPRANLAVTKDGETYNKLQRPDHLFEKSAASSQENERKRQRASVDQHFTDLPSDNKRAKTRYVQSQGNITHSLDDKRQHRSAGPVSECGMRTTLPIDEADQNSDDSMGEALSYLRSVRSEASAIPHLLVASNKTQHEDTDRKFLRATNTPASSRAFYQDGAWISVNDCDATTRGGDYEYEVSDTQESYHKQLIKRFETLRSTLCEYKAHRSLQGPNIDAGRLPSANLPSNRHEWLYTLDREYPTGPVICRLDEKNIKRGLEYCITTMDRFDAISGQKSCWIWALLAISGDVGTLDSQKMGHIRDLGNKAGELSTKLHKHFGPQDRGTEDYLLREDRGTGEQEGESGADETAFSEAGDEDHEPTTNHLSPGPNEQDLDSKCGKSLNNSLLGTQSDVQSLPTSTSMLDVPITAEGSTDTDTNDQILERARARLLAQLGDNLVQAGMPALTSDRDQLRPQRDEEPGHEPEGQLHEIRIRAIPSRAEAERQRQRMRTTQDSGKVGFRGAISPHSEPSALVNSVVEDDSTPRVDLNTRVTIDMILTVVSECYGQRDLLRFRKPW